MDANCMILGVGLAISVLIAIFFAIQYFEARDEAKRMKATADSFLRAYDDVKMTIVTPNHYHIEHLSVIKSYIVYAVRFEDKKIADAVAIKGYTYSTEEEGIIAKNLCEELVDKLNETV